MEVNLGDLDRSEEGKMTFVVLDLRRLRQVWILLNQLIKCKYFFKNACLLFLAFYRLDHCINKTTFHFSTNSLQFLQA